MLGRVANNGTDCFTCPLRAAPNSNFDACECEKLYYAIPFHNRLVSQTTTYLRALIQNHGTVISYELSRKAIETSRKATGACDAL